jgi:hypothetical protein
MSQLRRAARAKPKGKHKRSHAKHAAKVGENENDRIAFDYFKSKGLTDEQAAGIVGNFDHESFMNPAQQQIGGGPGRGIGQWSVGDRWNATDGDNVADLAKKEGKSPTSLEAQLDFTWYELNHSSGYGLSQLRSSTTVEEATTAFQNHFERPNKKKAGTADRIAHAKAALAAFGGSRRITEGEDSVVLGRAQQPAAHVDSPDTGGGKIKEGHPTVFVGKKQLPFARVGDPTKIKDGAVVDGDETVLLGGQPGSSQSGSGGSGTPAQPQTPSGGSFFDWLQGR